MKLIMKTSRTKLYKKSLRADKQIDSKVKRSNLELSELTDVLIEMSKMKFNI